MGDTLERSASPSLAAQFRRMTETAARPAASRRVLLLISPHTYRAQAFMAAAEELGIELTIATGDRLPLAAPSNPSLLEIDIRHGEVAGRQIGELDARRRLAAVLAAEDEGALATALGGRRIGCAANPARAVTLAQDKLAMRRALARAGLPTP
jgi:hypothetical protein